MTTDAENTLDELMSRDPLALTKDPQARAVIIAAIRAHQALVAKRLAEGKALPRRKRAKKAEGGTGTPIGEPIGDPTP